MEQSARWEFDDVVVDRSTYRLVKAGREKTIGPRAFDLLVDLLQHPGRLVDKQELIERVWKGAAVTDNALTRAVKEVREAIGDNARDARYIETITRRGYRLIAHVRSLSRTRVMLAVLPFSDLSRHPEEYFCDGLTEEMITQIARLDGEQLGVTARTSALSYKNSRKAVGDIARELGVDYLLEGSVRRVGHRVRITAQLIEARGQTHVWADSYEEPLADVLRVQARAAEAVARAVRLELQPRAPTWKPPTSTDPEAYAAYLKGRYLWNRRTANSIREALGAFQQAISRDPTFARAYAGLARCYASFILGLWPRVEAEPNARTAVVRAIELDGRLAEAHATLGALESIDGNLAAAERAFRRAVFLDPNDVVTRHWYAMHCLVELGRFEEALRELRGAQALDPLALIVHADIAAVYYLMRQPDTALDRCRRVLDLDPTFARAHVYAGWVHSQMGSPGEAVAAFETAKRLDDSPWTAGWLGYGLGQAGRRSEAQQVLDELRQASVLGREVAFFEAVVYTGLREWSCALDRLEKACSQRSLAFSVLQYMPAFDDLRNSRRSAPLLRRAARGTAPDRQQAGPSLAVGAASKADSRCPRKGPA